DRSYGVPVDGVAPVPRLHLRLGGRAVRGDLGDENARTRLQLALPALARGQITQGQAPASAVLLAGIGGNLVLGELRDGHFQVARLAVPAHLEGDCLAHGRSRDQRGEVL